MREITDEKLMEYYSQGDFEAFELLYCRYSQRLFGYLKGKVQAHQIEDLCQQVWTKLHDKRKQFKKEFRFAPWFFVIARNTVIDNYRKNNKGPHSEFEEDKHGQCSQSEKIALKLEVIDELSQLEPKYKEALNLRYIEELDFAEIAKSLEITEANTRKRISRGLKKFKDLWHRGDHE